jgi:outer membrane protein TolC
MVGVSFSHPIANRTAKGNLAQARANERASELSLRDLESVVRLQVRLAVENVGTAQESVVAARLARVFREEDLRVEQKKFEKGMSTTFLVLAKQNDLNASKAAELQAQIGLAKAITALEQAEGKLLEARGFVGPAWPQARSSRHCSRRLRISSRPERNRCRSWSGVRLGSSLAGSGMGQ